MSAALIKDPVMDAEPLVLGRRAPVRPAGPTVPTDAPAEVASVPVDAGRAAELARREAEIEQRWREAEEAFESAEHAGRTEGLKRGEEEARRQLERKLAELGDALRDLVTARECFERQLEEQALPIVVEAITLVFGQLAQSETHAVAAVREALARFPRREHIEVRVLPRHADWISQALARDELGVAAQQVSVTADPSVQGGCLVETPSGGLDASLATQLGRLIETLSRKEAP